MSSKMPFKENSTHMTNATEWTTFGTAISHFKEICHEDYLNLVRIGTDEDQDWWDEQIAKAQNETPT